MRDLVQIAFRGVQSIALHLDHQGPEILQVTPFVGGTLIDVAGRSLVQNSVVLVKEGRIERVGTQASLPVPAGYREISTEGMSVLPGLWDMHTHLQSQHSKEAYTERFFMDQADYALRSTGYARAVTLTA